ncbi:MAG: hypothetical protein HYR55_17580 [Acidobacteria bacterium]|nr:hypothetical protein [Acidobacteriota bacterium]
MNRGTIGSKWLCGLVAAALLSGCGYRASGTGAAVPRGLHTLGIPTLTNSTHFYEIEQRFTQALVREFVERGKFSIVPKDTGVDAVLRGEITAVGVSPMIYGRDTFGSTFLITVYLKVSIVQTKTNKVIYQNDGFVFRDQYMINARVLKTPGGSDRLTVEQFFSEENTAIDRIAKDFASSVAITVLETF